MQADPVTLGSSRGRRILLLLKNTREDPARHAAETEQDQPQHAAGLETTMEIR